MTTILTPAPAGAGELQPRVGVLDTLRHAGTLAWRSIAQLRHNPDKLFDVTLMPVFFLLMFVYVFGGAIAGDTQAYLQQLVPGMMAMIVTFAAQGLGITMNEDITKGVFDRFRSLPIARSAPLIGAVLADVVRFAIAMTILLGFGAVLGFRVQTGVLNLVAALGLAYAFSFALSWISALLGMALSSPQAVQGMLALFVIPLTFGSSIMVADVGTMPGWLQAWVNINPLSDLADASRSLLLGGPVATHALPVLAWAIGITAVCFPLAIRAYRRKSR